MQFIKALVVLLRWIAKKRALAPFLILSIGLFQNLRADGPKPWRVKLQVETKNGKKFTGYIVVAEPYCSLDTLKNSKDTPSILRQFSYQQYNDTQYFYRNPLFYNFLLPYKDGQDKPIKSTANTYLQRTKILSGNIKQIKVLSINLEPDYQIEGKHTQADTLWMRSKLLKTLWLEALDWDAPWCSYGFFYHEQQPELDALTAKLRKLLNKESPGEADKKALKLLLNKITRYKVVLVSRCTC